jgi:hypothetical protein
MRSLLLVESLDLRPSNQYILVSEESKLFTFSKNVCVPDEVQGILHGSLEVLHIIYMDRWARFASRSERHMDRLSFISFHTPSVLPGLDFE